MSQYQFNKAKVMATGRPPKNWRMLLLSFLAFLPVIKGQPGAPSTNFTGSGSGSTNPGNSFPQVDLYPFGLESGDIELTPNDDSSFSVLFSFPFAGVYFDTIYINTNGIISLGSEFLTPSPSDFPFDSPPLIAPFWIDLITRNGSTISYRFLNDTTAVDSAVHLYNNFSSPTYVSSGVLLVTWDQVEFFGRSETTGTFQVLLTTDGISSYVFYAYSDEIYPSGAVVGINVGDGINFDLQASLSLRNSETIAQGTNIELFDRRGLYFYRLDNLPGSPSSSTPSTSTASCVDGDVSVQQFTIGTFISSEGLYVGNVSLLLTTCVGGIFAGVCRRGFDDVDAEVACRNLGLPVLGGEVAEDQFNNYTGPIVIQDVECSGNASSLSECNVNTFITTECLSSSSIVRINCFFYIPFGCSEGIVSVDFQLSSSERVLRSQVGFCLNGTYGAVCQIGFDDADAEVACQTILAGLTITRSQALYSSYTNNMGPILLQNVTCDGSENVFNECEASTEIDSSCLDPSNAVGVLCYYEDGVATGSTPGSGSDTTQLPPAGPFLPSGEIANDRVLPSGCNQYSMPISLSPPFVYFGQNQSSLYINSNGYFTFGEIFTSCCNVYFPTLSPPLIAVLWHGYNTSRFEGEGNVTYRLTRDPETLDIISNFISEIYFPFVPSYAVVATWNMVPTDNSSDFSRYTFQAILASNGRYSFVTFTYGNLDGIRGVQVGFNLGDGYNYGDNVLTNSYLFSSSIDIHYHSNVGIPGVYSFRVDNLTSSFGPTLTPPTDITPTIVTSFTPDYSCFDGELRLLTINSTIVTTRNLETFTRSFIVPVICINGTLGYVCDRGWDTEDAAVICRYSFFSYSVATQPVYGVMVNSSLPPVNYAIQDVNCTTYDFYIQNCGRRLADSTVCGAGGSSSIAGVICEELPRPCFEGEFRIRNQTYDFNGYQTISGRVEFCQNGTFTPVCSEGFGQMEAQTVCRSMYSQYYDASIFEVDGWPGDVLSSLECNMTRFGGYICRGSTNTCQDPTTVAGVICTEVISLCFSNGDLRYTNVDTVTNSSGTFTTARAEVCYSGTYGSICDKYMTNETAEFACRERFFATTGRVISSPNLASSPPIVLERIDACQTAFYCGGANFGITDPDCRNSSRAVGISCSRACFDGDTRIVGGDRYYEGVVEICRNGEWGVICDQGWNDISAAVLCQERGFGAGGSAARYGLSSSRPVVTSNVTCNLRYNPSLSTCLNCTSIPNGCSSQTVAGVRCQPDLLMLNIVSDGIAEYNSSFSLRCNGVQTPYNSTLDSYQWIDSNGPIMDDARRSTRIVPSGVDGFYYRTFFFNTSLDFQGLCVQDAGIYNCSMSINITYPDGPNNSSAIITNMTYYALWIRVPPPDVTLVVPPSPYTANEPFQVSCVVNTVEGVAIRDVNIGWYENGQPITSSFDSRVTASEVVALNATWFSRTINVSRLIGSDTGNYTCRSSITGLYFYSDEVSIVTPLEVEGVPNDASAPRVTAVGSMDQTLLEGESVMITALIDAIPSVMVGDIQWYFTMFGSNVTINITESTLLGDGRTRLQFSPNRQSLMLSDVSLSSSGLYFVVASNLAGSGSNFTLITVQSPPVRFSLGVQGGLYYDPSREAYIIVEGSTLVFNCSFQADPEPSVVWRLNVNTLQNSIRHIITGTFANTPPLGYTEHRLVVKNVGQGDSGNYTCDGTNEYGSGLMAQTVTVIVPPSVIAVNEEEIGVETRDGSPSFISISFDITRADPKVTPADIIWTYALNNTESRLVNETDIYPSLNFTMDKTSVIVSNLSLSDAGKFTVIATNEAGSHNASVMLIIHVEPELTDMDYSGNTTKQKNTIYFWCVAVGVPPPRIVWLHNESLILLNTPQLLSRRHSVMKTTMPSTDGLMAVNSTLKVTNVRLSDAGEYLCRVDPANINKGRPDIPEPFEVIVYPEPINYCASDPCLNGGTCSNVTNGYLCNCDPMNWKGINCQTEIFKFDPPVIVMEPEVEEFPQLFMTINIVCEVAGTPQPNISWYKDGILLPLQVSQTLLIEEVTLEDRGIYHCAAENFDPNAGRVEIFTEVSSDTVLNIKGIAQYKAELSRNDGSGRRRKRQTTNLIPDNIIEQIASILSGYELPQYNATVYSVTRDPVGTSPVNIIITLIAPQGSAELKESLFLRLQQVIEEVNSNVAVDATIVVLAQNISRFDGCETDESVLEPLETGGLSITLNWPESDIGQMLMLQCPCGNLSAVSGQDINNAMAQRVCGGNFSHGGQWKPAHLSPCNFSSTTRQLCQVANLLNMPEEAISTLDHITSNEENIGSTEIGVTTILLEALTDTAAINQSANLTKGFLTVVDNLLDANKDEIQMSQEASNSSARILEVIETVSENIPFPENESEIIISLTSFAIAVQEFNPQTFTGQVFSAGLGADFNFDKDKPIDLNALMIGKSTSGATMETASLSIPQTIFNSLGKNTTNTRITNSVFLNDALFLGRNNTSVLEVGGIIIAAALSNGRTVENLKPPVMITFLKKPSLENGSDTTCRFWDFSADDGYGEWSTRGCNVTNETDTLVVCECDHLTNFAILLDPNPDVHSTPPPEFAATLSALSYIGAIISIICLIMTIVTYLSSKKLCNSEAGRLLVNLCLAMLGLYILYIVSLHAKANQYVCAVAGGLLHYFMLASFLAMAAEAVNLYTKLVVVLGVPPIIKNKYVLKACLIVWILPFFIVLISEAPNWENYVSDYFCRPFHAAFYGGLMVPFILIYVFNWVIFVIIFVSLLRKKATKAETSKNSSTTKLKQNFIIALTLSLLFGLGWGFGLVATTRIPVKEISYTLQTIFVLLTCFQGLLIFIMHCVRSKEANKQWKSWVYIFTCHKVSLETKKSSLTGHTSSDYGKGTQGKYNKYSTWSTTAQGSKTLQRILKKEMDSSMVSHSDTIIDNENSVFSPSLDPLDEEKKIDLSSDAIAAPTQDEQTSNPFVLKIDDTRVEVNQNYLEGYGEEMEMKETVLDKLALPFDGSVKSETNSHHSVKIQGDTGPEAADSKSLHGEAESIVNVFDIQWVNNGSRGSQSSLQSAGNEKRKSRLSGLEVADLTPAGSNTEVPTNSDDKSSPTSETKIPVMSSSDKTPLIDSNTASDNVIVNIPDENNP